LPWKKPGFGLPANRAMISNSVLVKSMHSPETPIKISILNFRKLKIPLPFPNASLRHSTLYSWVQIGILYIKSRIDTGCPAVPNLPGIGIKKTQKPNAVIQDQFR